MGVVLGTLTTRDGRVIPLPDAAGEMVAPVEDEYRKEERKYSKCIHRPIVGQIWDDDKMTWLPVTQYGWYQVGSSDSESEPIRKKMRTCGPHAS